MFLFTHRAILCAVAFISFHICAMENDEYGYKKICTIQVPYVRTLATNSDYIAIGTALGPVKLYDTQGTLKKDILHCGDGGLALSDDNRFTQVSRKGEVVTRSMSYATLKKSFNINSATYSLAYDGNNLFFGSNDDSVHAWDLDGKHLQTYTGAQAGLINAVQVTSKAVVSISSNGRLASTDRETGANIWLHYSFYPGYALAKDNSLCYAGYDNGELLIADPATNVHHSVDLKRSLFALACLKSGYLIAGNRDGISLYDVRLFGKPLVQYLLENKKSRIIALEATENGFVSAADDGTVDVWLLRQAQDDREEVQQK